MMKGMKGRFLRKLKSISTINALRQVTVFQANPSNQNFHTSTVDKEKADETNNPKELFPGSISIVPKALDQVEDEEIDSAFHDCERENFGVPPIESKDAAVPAKDHPEISIAMESGSTNARTVPLPMVQLLIESDQTFDFQPDPLLKIKMVMEHNSSKEAKEENEEIPTMLDFEGKCPPGGSEAVILYTTSLRGIRKTFEDCRSIRFLLESFQVLYHERDVSMHLEFRDELWRILGSRVVPPRLFIRGRHVGGADEVIGLHEQGRLRSLFHGMPLNPSNTPCNGCGGVRFVVCFNCNGSRKVIPEELTNELSTRCGECNENGLIKCPICC